MNLNLFTSTDDLDKLPLALEDLLSRGLVERERLEYKRGFNPEEILHTLCAFANDFYNLDGGYIVIGIATNENGQPILPPVGVPENTLDKIGRKLEELGHKIFPQYHPFTYTCTIEGSKVLVLWAPPGEQRPYKCLKRLSEKHKERAFYIRRNSCTVEVTTQTDEAELINLANKTPYDDRLNQNASVADLDRTLITEFLKSVNSGLAAHAAQMEMDELGTRLNIVKGPPELRRPLNVGLMFFHPRPDTFFPQAQIDVVIFPDDPGGDVYSERIFTGPLGQQLTDSLSFIRTNVLQTIVIKDPHRAQARRVANYPFQAIEEILCNAVYHRSYATREPIEVRVLRDRITITSFPGPHPSLDMDDFRHGIFPARRNLNRRIGEFLKELKLTEGRGTGIPKVLRAMQQNGSPAPRFQTDANREFLCATLPIHPRALELDGDMGGNMGGQPPMLLPKLKIQEHAILEFCREERTRAEIQTLLGLRDSQYLRQKYLQALIGLGYLEMTIPDKPRSVLQKYRTTRAGLEFLASLT